MSMTKCAGCGKSIREYPIALHRTSPKGEPFVGKCNECLGKGENTNTQETAILDALGLEPERGGERG